MSAKNRGEHWHTSSPYTRNATDAYWAPLRKMEGRNGGEIEERGGGEKADDGAHSASNGMSNTTTTTAT